MAKREITQVRNSHGNLVKLNKGESLRPDGILVYRYTASDGKRRTLSSTTIEGLREKEKGLNIDKVKGVKSHKGTYTVDKVADEWFELKRGLREHTRHNYVWLYDQYIRDNRNFGRKQIKTITFGDVLRYYNHLMDSKGLTISTIDGLQTVLRQIFEYAVRAKYIDVNPTIDALKNLRRTYNTGDQKHKALTLEEHTRFLTYVKESPTYNHWYSTFAVMVGTGMRVGELTGLTWNEVDFDKGIVNVSHTLVYYKSLDGGMTWEMNDPKTKAGKRKIVMLDSVREALEAEKNDQDENNRHCTVAVNGFTDFVFFNRFGNVQHQGTLNKALRRIIRDANMDAVEKNAKGENIVMLPKFSCHNLRTTFCTRLAENGVSLKVAMSLMGHDDARTTMSVYTSVCEDWEKRELKAVNEALKGIQL